MPQEIDISTFLIEAKKIPVVDVRTPAEYKQGRIPVAHNLPLFSNSERQSIGITYKKKGSQNAILKGLDYAGPKLKSYVKKASRLAAGNQLLVYCWRGGMRSASMAWLLEISGMHCHVLKGGYKSFRSHVLSYLTGTFPFIVIGGLTGSGKTDVLKSLSEAGEQVLDLEGLAHHKGSAFGSLGEPAQNTNEQFENEIFWNLSQLNHDRIIWIEDESRGIGKNILPKGVHDLIRSAPVVFLELPLEVRIERLVRDYACFPDELIIESIHKISNRLGGKITRDAIAAVNMGDYSNAARMVLSYYDKTYGYGLSKRDAGRVFRLKIIMSSTVESLSDQVLQFSQNQGLIPAIS